MNPPDTVASSTPSGVTPWQRPVSRLVVEGSAATGLDLSMALSSAAGRQAQPWVAPLISGPEADGKLTAWFEQDLTAEQSSAVVAAVQLLQGQGTVALTLEPGTVLDLAFTPAQEPPTPTSSPWSQDVGDRIAAVLTAGGGLGTCSTHTSDEGGDVLSYRGPQLTDDAVAQLREIVASVADADGVEARTPVVG